MPVEAALGALDRVGEMLWLAVGAVDEPTASPPPALPPPADPAAPAPVAPLAPPSLPPLHACFAASICVWVRPKHGKQASNVPTTFDDQRLFAFSNSQSRLPSDMRDCWCRSGMMPSLPPSCRSRRTRSCRDWGCPARGQDLMHQRVCVKVRAYQERLLSARHCEGLTQN